MLFWLSICELGIHRCLLSARRMSESGNGAQAGPAGRLRVFAPKAESKSRKISPMM